MNIPTKFKFCIAHDENNENLKTKINDIKIKLKNGLPLFHLLLKMN